LDALEFVVKLRQREDATEFIWPEYNNPFDERLMQSENDGTEEDFAGKRLLLALVPAAVGRLFNKQETEAEMEVYYKASVILDMEGDL